MEKSLKRKSGPADKPPPEKLSPESIITLKTFDEIIDFAIEKNR